MSGPVGLVRRNPWTLTETELVDACHKACASRGKRFKFVVLERGDGMTVVSASTGDAMFETELDRPTGALLAQQSRVLLVRCADELGAV